MLDWHDSILLEMRVDRRIAPDRDEVVLTVEWPDRSQQDVCFGDCYELRATMNFGVIGLDCILEARCLQDSPELALLRHRLVQANTDLASLRVYEITTNTTASSIRVFARTFDLIDRSERRAHKVRRQPWHGSFVRALGQLADATAQRRAWVENEFDFFVSPAELLAIVFDKHRRVELEESGVFSVLADERLRAMHSLVSAVNVEQSAQALLSDPAWLSLVALAGKTLRAVCDALDD